MYDSDHLSPDDPFAVFRAVKLLFLTDLCDGVDMLGAASGLLKTQNKTDILINLHQEDADFLLDVGNILEQREDEGGFVNVAGEPAQQCLFKFSLFLSSRIL